MSFYHKVSNIYIKSEILHLEVDGKVIEYSLKDVSPLLARANDKERKTFELSPSGYGIYWPLLDEDIAIDGLLGISHKPQQVETVA